MQFPKHLVKVVCCHSGQRYNYNLLCSKKAALYKNIKFGCNLPLGWLKITEAEVDVLLPDRLSQHVETWTLNCYKQTYTWVLNSSARQGLNEALQLGVAKLPKYTEKNLVTQSQRLLLWSWWSTSTKFRITCSFSGFKSSPNMHLIYMQKQDQRLQAKDCKICPAFFTHRTSRQLLCQKHPTHQIWT